MGGVSPSTASALSSVPLASSTSSSTRAIFVLRHGSRPDNAEDPYLDSLGREEAQQVAAYFTELTSSKERELRIGAIFSSPYRRALETAVPVAEALNVPIRIEYGFCELLLHRYSHNSDPIPALQGRTSDQLPGYFCIDWMYNSAVVPEYPDAEGQIRPGVTRHRQKALQRHRRALDAALAEAPPGTSILVVGHGCTHDFVADALSPDQHLEENHTGNHRLVPHCAITELREVPDQATWDLRAYGHTRWKRCGVAKAAAGDVTWEVQAAPAQRRSQAQAKIAQIEAMGFQRTHAEAALLAYDGNLERSIEALLDGRIPPEAPAALAFTGNDTTVIDINPRQTHNAHTERQSAVPEPEQEEESLDAPAPVEKVHTIAKGCAAPCSSAEALIDILAALQERHQPPALAACKAKGESFPHVQTTHGHTLLHLTAMAQPRSGEAAVDSATALLNARALVNACNDHGETPLLLAIRAAEELRSPAGSAGRSCSSPAFSRQTSESSHRSDTLPGDGLQLVRLLLERRADSNATDPPSGETALMEAADYGDFAMCRLLLDFRADPLRQSVKGFTARYLAEGPDGSPPVAQLLRESEAAILAGH